MSPRVPLYGLVLSTLVTFSLAGCQEGPAERAGERVDRAAESAGDSLERAGERTRDRVER